MYKAFGIVNSSSKNIRVEGLEDYRPIGAFSFLGRYRVIDFPISNLSNSDIDRIQIYVQEKPRTLVSHIGTGRHYNINSKSGRLQILFSDTAKRNDIYNTDIAAYYENLECIEAMHHEYVVITPDYMVYSADFSTLIEQHIDSGADITLLYHSVDNAKEAYLNCNILNLNKQRGVLSIEPNHGNAKNRNIFMDTYIMKKDLLVDLIKKARATSSAFTLTDIINELHNDLDVRGISHRGFFASITDFQSYYDANMDLINIKTAQTLFDSEWPIYTRTNDSCPTHYYGTAEIRNSVVSNGCQVEGTIENSILGRGCIIHKGAVIKNSVVLAGAEIGEGVHVENQVVDKLAKILHVKEVVSDPALPGYIKRGDII
jgi:glucose-1-phosphate adenylyltransferase